MPDILREAAVALGIGSGVAFTLIYIFRKVTANYELAGYNRAMLEMARHNAEAVDKAINAVVSNDPSDIVRDSQNRD